MARLAGKYLVGRRIGCGGMAEVFEGEVHGAAGFRRPVAIKRVHPTFSADPAFAELFVKEAVLSAQLDHPNIVSVIDFDRDASGRLFLVMELVRGVDLRQLIRGGPLPVSVATFIAAGMLRGLRHAHELATGARRGILHRDISPHNVLLSWSGAVKLSDFGIAKAFDAAGASCSGRAKGKIAYMSPEQARGLRLDERSDLFAVGAVLHEMLTGKRLLRSGSAAELLARLLSEEVARPGALRRDVPPAVDALVMRLMARDREARFASAREALEAAWATGAAGCDGDDALAATLRERCPRDREPLAAPHDPATDQTSRQAATLPARPRARRSGSTTTKTLTAPTSARVRLSSRHPAPLRTRRARTLASIFAAAITRRP